jgi:hypothetical protein
MALASPTPVVDIEVAGGNRPYVDWPAIIAGAILASAISFVLFTFGTGIGLSLTSPYPGESVSPTAFAVILGLWVLWVATSSFIAGGYLTGRLRRRIGDASEHEVEVRDAAHGLLVWALSALIGAMLAAWVTGLTASKTADVAAGVATGASAGAAQEVASRMDPASYWSDVLFRPAPAAAGQTGAAPATTETAAATAPATTTTGAATTAPAATTTTGAATTETAQTTAPAAPAAPAATAPAPAAAPMRTADMTQSREAANRILVSRIMDGKLSDDDRAYLARLVSDETGLSEADAAARVDAAVTGLSQARAEAARLAERARKFGILITFLTAASLAVGAAACWWAATIGGRHRDQATDFSHVLGRRF